MIPKIIHYCWLSGDSFPTNIQQCLNSWKKHLSGYEIWLWDANRFDVNSISWTKQAFEAKKYAFAADYIRLYALYNYGGIYLDSDVTVYKKFDKLLRLPYFIGHDQIRAFEAAVIGAEKGCKWVKDMVDSYEGKTFVKQDGSYDMLTLPCRMHLVLTGMDYKFHLIHKETPYAEEAKVMYVFDGDFFNSRNAVEVRQTPKSYCAHNYANSWQSGANNRKEIKNLLPKWMLKNLYVIGQRTWARHKYAWFQIPFE